MISKTLYMNLPIVKISVMQKKLYSSHVNGSNLKSKEIMNLIRRLPPEVSEAAKEDVDHLHIKRKGMGETVLVGFYVGVCFYIIGIDVNHELI